MKNKLHDYRKLYQKHRLLEEEVPGEPFSLFDAWIKQADETSNGEEINTMTLATIGSDGFPKSRIVLLKEYDAEGFVFFTNYQSQKGNALDKHPKTCLSFFWPALERQVIIKGVARKTSDEDSDAYFSSRPRESQLGAWASEQSAEIPSRDYLENRLKDLEKEFKDKEVPRPAHWGGIKVYPEQIEFWQGRPSRLHDRIIYSKDDNMNWNKTRLAP
jgi:pyridoxamine 5'-phosphate oxidase